MHTNKKDFGTKLETQIPPTRMMMSDWQTLWVMNCNKTPQGIKTLALFCNLKYICDPNHIM